MKHRTFIAVIMLTGGLCSAQQITWNNAQANGLWDVNISSNWSSSTGRFLDGNDVIFSNTAAGSVGLFGSNVAPSSVQFTNTTGKDYILGSSSGESLMTTSLLVTGSGNVMINSVIAGTSAITHSGTGFLILAGANTFSGGGILVRSGSTLVTGNDFALGSTAQVTALTIEEGGTLNVGDSQLYGYGVGSIKVRGHGVDGKGAIVKSDGYNFNVFNGELEFTGDTTIRSSARLDFDGEMANFTGSRVSLTKVGSQMLFLSNTILGNGFDWNLREGTLAMEGGLDSSVNSMFKIYPGASLLAAQNTNTIVGDLVLNGGTVRTGGDAQTWTFSGNLNVLDSSTIDPAGVSSIMRFSGALSGPGHITVSSLGTVIISGTPENHSGNIVLSSGGKLQIDGNYSNSTGTIRIRSGATLSGNNGTWGGNVIIESGGTLASGVIVNGTVTNASLTFTAFSEVAGAATLPAQWKFYWNAPTGWSPGNQGNLSTGAVTDRNSWRPMVWGAGMWSADGDNAPNISPSDYLRITATGGHTGSVGVSRDLDRYTIASYKISQEGDYELLLGKITTQAGGNGVLVKIFLNGSQYDEMIVPNNNHADFSYIFNGLTLNDEIAVAVGANGDGAYDSFNLNYRIALLKPEFANPQLVNVADYGAVGDGVTNDGPAVLNAINAWKNLAGPTALHFEANKTYYLGERTEHKSYFLLNGLTDKVVEGNGAKLILTPSNRCFSMENCDNMVVRNLSVDYSSLTFSQGVITSIDAAAGTFVFTLQSGYPAPILEGNHGWGSVYDPATRNLRKNVSDHIFMNRLTNLGNGRFEFRAEPSYSHHIAGINLNDLFVFRAYSEVGIPGGDDWAFVSGNGNVAFDNIHIQCAPGFVFRVQRNMEPMLFRNIKISPPDGSQRLVSSFGDGFHCVDNRFGPIIENGYFSYLMDDSIHIKSTGFVIHSISGNTLVVSSSGTGHRVGDKFRFLDQLSQTMLGEATVTAISGSGITVDALPTSVQADDYIHNITCDNDGFVVQKNYFGKKRRVAAILRGSDGKVLNNVSEDNDGFWFLDSSFFNGVMEGTTAENILFQGNTIRNCTDGLMIYSSYSNYPVQNIRIIDNIFEGPTNLNINTATKLRILGNQFWTTPIAKLNNIKNVTIGHSTDVNGNLFSDERSLLTGNYSAGELIIDTFDYNDWVAKAGLYGTSAAITSDPDYDGMDNLLEYALSGNPTRNDAVTVMPNFQYIASENLFHFVHKKRTNDSNLVYTIQTSNNLASGSWAGISLLTSLLQITESATVNNFKTVTYKTFYGQNPFIRLKVELR